MGSTTSAAASVLRFSLLEFACSSRQPVPMDEATSAVADDSGTEADGTTTEWCAPPSRVFHSNFVVPPDFPFNPDQSSSRPAGRYVATCTVDTVRRVELPEVNAWELHVDLTDCVDEAGVPTSQPLSAALITDVIEALPVLGDERRVGVDYTIEILAPANYQAWYSLRDAESGELLVAAFSEHGPRVGPALSGSDKSLDWLLPFTAQLGDHACPPDPRGCEDSDTPRQRFLDICRDTECWSIVGISAAELDDYLFHLGFAGDPDVCDFIPTTNAIEGILAKR